MKRTWTVRREGLERADADRRWDRAYQALLAWSPPGVALLRDSLDSPGRLPVEAPARAEETLFLGRRQETLR